MKLLSMIICFTILITISTTSMPFDLSTARRISQPANNFTGQSTVAKEGIKAVADINKAARIELQKSGAEKFAEYVANNQRLVDIIRNAEQGMALLKPQEFADKKSPYMPTKYGTHLGGGFPSLREAYQEHISNDPTLRALQDVSANADLASAQKSKGQCPLTDFERQLVGISAKVDPFKYDEAQFYEALYNQKMRALELQSALKNEATFKPNLIPNNGEQRSYSQSITENLTPAQELELQMLRAKYGLK